jgi:Na+/phosphate symporter
MLGDSDRKGEERAVAYGALPVALNEGFLVMTGRLVEMAFLLSACISSHDASRMNRCEMLASEVREQEKALTRELVTADKEGDLLKAFVHLPFRFERIAEQMESILSCCRVKCSTGILFSGKAEADLQQLLAILLDMMSNLRDAFSVPDSVLVESIISEGGELSGMLRGLRSAQWSRPEPSPSMFQGTSLYLDILDAIKSASEDLGSVCKELLHAQMISTACTNVPEAPEAGKFE